MKVDVSIRIDQEGSRGFMWHLIHEGRERVVSINNYLNPDFAETAAVNFLEHLQSHELKCAILEEGETFEIGEHPWDHDGKYEFSPNTFHMDKSSDWGWAGVISLEGPMALEACTYYTSQKEDMLAIWNFLNEATEFHIVEITEYRQD